MSFERLRPEIKELIQERGWEEPTEPQRKSIDPVLDGEDVLLTAPTGAGKTEAVALPLLHKIMENDNDPISVLYITPLRALNRDMFDRLLWWCRKLGIEVAIRHGDTSDYERRKQAEFPEQIFVTTPETLQAILPGSKMREHLKNVEHVVVDEIHELVGSKRGTQLSLGLQRLKELGGKPQLIGLSATVGSPGKVSRFLSDETEVIEATETENFTIEVDSPVAGDDDRALSERIYAGEDIAARLNEIHHEIVESESSLVFTNTRESAEILSSRLRRLEKEYEHSTHHSSLSKDVRINNEEDFKDGDIKSLICTSSLELGIDIGKIDKVIQYGSPRRVSNLLQRVGRSGHRIEEESYGKVIALNPDDIIESSVIAKMALNKELEETRLHESALDVLANQIIGYCLDEYGVDWRKVYELFTQSYYYRNLSEEDFYRVLRFLSNLNYVWIDEKVKRSKKSWEYYYENLSTIPDTYQYQVIDTVEGSEVGQLDESFVAEYGDTGTTFVMKGRSWRILSVEEGQVNVEPVEEKDSAIPAWEGELIPVPKDVAEGVSEMRRKIMEWLDRYEENEVVERIIEEYPLSKDAARKLIPYIKESEEEIGEENEMLIERKGNFTVLHSCYGTLVNQTLSKYIASVLIDRKGRSVAVKNDPYRIMIQGAGIEEIKDIMESSTPEDLEFTLDTSIEKSQMFKWRFIHAAKRFGAVQNRAKWDKVNISRIIDSYEDSPIFEEAKREVFTEKMDVESTKEIVRRINDGKIRIKECEGGKIAKKGLTYKFKELMGPEKPREEIFKVFKKRLLNTKLRMMCMRCGEYKVTKKVRDIEDDINCPVCGSGRITVTKPYEKEKDRIVDKISEGEELTEDEKEKRNKMERTADLVLTYGSDFIEALAGKGVGPETAIRIMAKQKEDKEGFYRAILEKEKEYTRTKQYWAD
ncbi:MAG: DEAD/DEAH box helicase [Candidatus Aenigmatarchaeota archaeon]